MNEVKNYDKIYDRAYSDGYAESINAGCSTGYAERYAERYAENYVENFKIGEAEAKIEVITELLRMGMSIKEGLQMANIDEKTYHEYLTKYADEEKFKQMCNAVSEYGDERAAKAVAEKTLKIIDKLLEMDMSLEQALQATHLDEKTYRENLAKYADKD